MADIFSMVDTWNNGATTFTAIKMNVTDTASAAGSLLLDLQIGGVSKISGTKAGTLQVANGTAVSPAYSFTNATSDGMFVAPASGIGPVFSAAGAAKFRVNDNGVNLRSDGAYRWSADANIFEGAGSDLFLFRDAANILAQRNGTAAQVFRLYNTYTDASNYERLEASWSANLIRLGTFNAGTGVAREFAFFIGNAEKMRINSTGNLLVGKATGGFVDSNNFAVEGSSLVQGHVTGTAVDTPYNYFVYGVTLIGSITQSGTTGVSYNTSSDYRLKDITGPVVDSGAFIDALRPVRGSWKVDGSPFVGFLAHEFQAVSPSSVTGTKDAVDAEGKPIYQSMQASSPEVMANVVAEMQFLRTRVTYLESQTLH